jgi:hypothetical protein
MQEQEDYLREQAWGLIVPGFTTLTDVTENMVELVEYDDGNPLTGERAAEIVRELWDQRLAELAEARGTDPTDDERVGAAFELLRTKGILASMNLGFERSEAVEESERLLGGTQGERYVYFHGQDAARLALPDAELFIGFGAIAPDAKLWKALSLPVAQRAVDALRAQGLTVRWNGSVDERIAVVGVTWLRPLPPV